MARRSMQIQHLPAPTLRMAIAAAVVVRVVLIAAAWWLRGPAAFTVPDTATYVTPAKSLVGAFAFTDAEGQAEVFRTPGYPLLLVPGVLAGHLVPWALGLHVFVAAALVMLTFRLARSAGQDERVAGICALAVALEPAALLWSIKVVPEAPFTALVVASALAATRIVDSGRARWSAATALLLVAAAYLKPIAYPLVLVVFAFLFLAGAHHRALRRQAVIFLLVCAALLAPWHVRNVRASGYAGFSTLAEHALYLSAGGSITARRERAPYADVRQRLITRARAEPEATRYRTMWQRGWRALRSDLLGYAATHLQGVARTVLDPAAVEYLRLFGRYPAGGGALVRAVDRGLLGAAAEWARSHPAAFWSSLALLVVPLVVLAAAAIGVARSRPWRAPGFVLAVILASYFLVAGGGVPGSSRFRVPAIPFMIAIGSLVLRRPDERELADHGTLRRVPPPHRLPRCFR